MRSRRRLSKRSSNRKFRKGMRSAKVNGRKTRSMRGGFRL